VIPFVLIFSIYGTSFSGHVDPWWCFLESASYLTYRILDEMDGKQARKTGNSSPLGLLFDHGCDSLTAGLLTLVIVKAIQCGNNYMVLLVLMGVT
jgi:ethanolaminephosphotransferase